MKFRAAIDIRAPRKQVYNRFIDPKQMPNWVKGFANFKPEKGKIRKVGSVARYEFNDGGGKDKLETIEKVLVHDREKEFTTEIKHQNLIGTVKTTFHDTEIGCKIDIFLDARFYPAPMNLLSPILRYFMKRQQMDDLRRLKNLIENGNR